MVGRPGRSKGCFNCRQRKKGCDLARPCCGQCTKSKIRCAGYDDKLGIIVYTPLASRQQNSLQSTALQVQYINAFWELLLPTFSSASQQSNRDWTRVIRDRYALNDASQSAMLALTLSRLGQHSGNHGFARSGAMHYNHCLRQVARKIDLQKAAYDDDVFAVCLIISLYEILCSPASQGHNWHGHLRGLGALIQLRGPRTFTSGLSHDLFVSARLNVIFASLVSRKATFLESDEWITVPWSTSAAPKSLYDKIVDLSAQVPRVLEMLDELRISRPIQTSDPESLLAACWRLDAELQIWHCELVATCSNLPSAPWSGFPYPTPAFDEPLTVETEIDHGNAQALSIYWMTCCFLYTTLRLVWQASDNPLYLLPRRIDPLRYVSLISRSLSYFSSAGEGSLVYYTMSMGAALHCLSVTGQLCSPEANRLKEIFMADEDPGKIDARVGGFLKTLAAAAVNSEFLKDEGSEKAMSIGRKWWGGGMDEVTLRPRTPAAKVVAISPVSDISS